MTKKANILFLIFLLLFISNFVYSEEIFNKEINSEDNINNKYQQDVFYPPEEALTKQGQTLESYIQSLKDGAPKNRNSSVDNIWGTTPLTGNIHIPVLLVQFTDNMHTLSLSDINAAFNSPNYLGGAGISVSKYYTTQSYGDLNITFDVYNWQTAPQTYSYYSLNSSRNFEMMLDTINMFDSTIDFSQYDNDGSGRTDGFVIIYPGPIGSAPTGIWPHARILRNYISNPVDGKYFGNIAAVPELGYYGNQFEVHVATHEFAHVLGLIDLYAIGPDGSGDGPIKNFTMMNFEFHPYCLNKPINLDVWSRYFLGWIEPMILTTDSSKEISLRSVNYYRDAVILKNSNMTDREFFIIENRYRNTSDPNNLDNCMFNNAQTTLGGFAIYHVDENKIEAHYPYNWVNWDPDGNWYDDTISHPGILYERNYTYSYSGGNYSTGDMYFNAIVQGCDSFRFFDENKRICTNIYAIDDSTTRTYSGVENPLIRFQALTTPNQSVMTAKMLVWEETETPQSSPPAGTYPQSTQVILSTATPNSIIYYTTDGSIPTQDSQVYINPITIPEGTTQTIKAIAKKDGYYISNIMSSTYTITGTVVTPTASQQSGIVDYGSQVILNTTTNGATIRYTLDGSTPTETSLIYNSPIIITESLTLKAKAFKLGYTPSSVSTYEYQVLVVEAPISTLASGYYDYGTNLELYTTTENAEIRYTIDGSEPNENSLLYTNQITILNDFTLKAKGFKQSYAPSQTSTYIYDSGPAPGNHIISFGFQGIDSQAEIDNDQNIILVYVPAGTYCYGLIPIIQVEDGCSVSPNNGVPQNFIEPVIYTVSSMSGQRVYTVNVIRNPQVFPPIANISGGDFGAPIDVELTTQTVGAIIKYTTNGVNPTLDSQTYTGPITISSTTTLKAKAFLYTGETPELDSSKNNEDPKAIADITPTNVIWQSSATLIENYNFLQKHKIKNKKDKPIFSNDK